MAFDSEHSFKHSRMASSSRSVEMVSAFMKNLVKCLVMMMASLSEATCVMAGSRRSRPKLLESMSLASSSMTLMYWPLLLRTASRESAGMIKVSSSRCFRMKSSWLEEADFVTP
eukprot:7799684-Lingulodinium_polyedra.AAC.1